MDENLKKYIESMKKPGGEIFYKIVWEQLPKISNCKVLDFGSGIGVTANHYAENNDVVAIERDINMVNERICENNYKQINGSIEELKKLKSNSFDMVLCHNVLEYSEDRIDVINELYRVLKVNGVLSIIKHNHFGRVMSKVVYENNLDEALHLLQGGKGSAAYFGEINHYDIVDIKKWILKMNLYIEKILGIRTFWALQQEKEKMNNLDYQEKMFNLEMKVAGIDEFKKIAFYNHILLKKF